LVKEKIKSLKDTLSIYRWLGEATIVSRLGTWYGGTPRNRRHLLLLAWAFPPHVGGGVYRPLSMVKYGTELGWKISVIAGPDVGTPSVAGLFLAERIPQEVSVWRVKPDRLEPSHNWSPRVDGGINNALNMFSLGKKVLEDDPPSAILATGPPFHTFVAAFYLARYFHSKMILDYRDEWTECPFDFINLGNVDRKWETLCLQRADLVYFTTNSQLEHQAKTFNVLDPKKCMVAPNGWDPNDFEAPPFETEPPGNDSGRLLISFIGNLAGHSLPGKFLRVLETVLRHRPDLKNILELRFVGMTSDVALKEIRIFPYMENIRLVGQVPKNDAIRMMQESSLLLLLNDKALSRYLPGKLYDYLASGTPILVFGEKGEVHDLVVRFDRGYVVGNDDTGALEKVFDSVSRGGKRLENNNEFKQWVYRHTRESLVKKMISEMESII
jgi:glycosyltransferase involved in cell wall biosynthesis